MKKNHSHFSRNILLGLSVFITVFTTILFTSCNEQSKSGSGSQTQKAAAPGTESKDYTMNCLMLTRAQIQTWVDSGWTRSGVIKQIIFQFYSPDAGNMNSNMQLIAYPAESASIVKKGGEQLLATDTTCQAVTFTGNVILANNEVSIDKLGILNPDGTLSDFDYIRLVPEPFGKDSQYISFKAEKVKNGAVQPMQGDEGVDTRPCPPWC